MILSIPSRSGPVIIVTTIIIDHGHWGRVICLPTRGGKGFTIPNSGHENAAKIWKIFSVGEGGEGLFDVYNLCEGLTLLQFVSL